MIEKPATLSPEYLQLLNKAAAQKIKIIGLEYGIEVALGTLHILQKDVREDATMSEAIAMIAKVLEKTLADYRADGNEPFLSKDGEE